MSRENLSSRAADVTARLTDPRGFTGTHKQRFDEEGRGRGMAGRMDLVDYDGNTTSATRSHNPYGSDQDLHPHRGSETNLSRSKSRESVGATAKKIKIFEYAEKHSNGEDLVLNKSFPSMEKMKDHVATLIPAGIPKIVIDKNMREVKDIDDFQNGEKYMAITHHDRAHFSEERVPVAFRE
ncbi:hypothetical protein BC832DRAFT_569316 [Gaertneriomyces semiglobifer]|nr:hypothetical protein BC832DRAFT_569316 [Gaertneriomyces semiglobifer]